MDDIHWTEIVFGAATFVIITTYHVYWLYELRYTPLKTYRGVAMHMRRVWVESVISEKRDILSVQTMRNWIMASSFLASTAMIIGLGLLSFFFRLDSVSELPFDFTRIFSGMRALFKIKLMCLMVHFFYAFFAFTLSIRYMNLVNFMINIPLSCNPQPSAEFIAHTLDTGMLNYTKGMRAFYLSVVVTLWLFGPVWMFAGSLVMVYVLYQLDHCCALNRLAQYAEVSCSVPTAGQNER